MALLLACLLLPAQTPLRDAIDAELAAAWRRDKVAPAGPADDGAFLRRVTLDLVGTVPTLDEVTAFLDDASPDKRAKAIDRLLADPRFAANQAAVWDLVLFGRNPPSPEVTQKRDGFRSWLAARFARNEPFDAVVRGLMLAEEEGSETFLAQYRSRPEDAAEAVSRLFLGTQLQCARCHDHPYDPALTQRDFYGMAGFLVRLVVLESGDGPKRRFAIGEKSTGEVLFSGAAKDARPGQKGEPVRPKFLGGAVLDEPALPKGFKEPEMRGAKTMPKPAFSRKEKLAAWLTAKDNPYFARAAVNRVWGQFMGRGLVHPVDDLGGKNAPSLPGLLDEMTRRFVESKFDHRRLVREIVSSKAYQLSGKGPAADALPRLYERARVRPLTAEELLASVRTANAFDATGGKITGAIAEYMRMYFGSPTNGHGEFQGGLMEHLFLNNSDELRGIVRRRKGNLADRVLTAPAGRRVELLFLGVLSRKPTPAERERFDAYLGAEKGDGRVEEAIWVLINSAAFRFNH